MFILHNNTNMSKPEKIPLPRQSEETLGVTPEIKRQTDGIIQKQWEDLLKSGTLSDQEKQWGRDILGKLFGMPYKIVYPEIKKVGRKIIFPKPEQSADFDEFVKKLDKFDLVEAGNIWESDVQHKKYEIEKRKRDRKFSEDEKKELEEFKKNNIIVYSEISVD